MEVPHRLAAVVVAVDDEAEAALGKSLLPGQSAGDKGNMPHQGSVFLGEIEDGGNVPAGDYQAVEGGLGGNIFYDDDGLVTTDDLPRMLTGDDAAENA